MTNSEFRTPNSELGTRTPRAFRGTVLFLAAWLGLFTAAAVGENSAYHAAAESITAEELFSHVDILADDTLEGRAAGSRGGYAAARYIETRLQELGVAPAGEQGRYAQPFYGSYRNLLARIDGSDERLKDEFLVVGAHYDHVGYGSSQTSYGPIGYIHNGADDNASGVSVLLESIEALLKLDRPPKRSILFAFWDSEEQGLLGSRYWIERPTVPLSAVQLALNVDMVGRMRNGKLELGGTRSGFGLRQLLSSRSLAKGMWLHFDWELRENSDHWPFFQSGIPVVLLHTGLHDDYHRPSDDADRVNQQGMRDAAVYLFDVLYRAANADALPRFRSQAQVESPHSQRDRERPSPPLPPRLGIAFRDALTAPSPNAADGEPTVPAADVPRPSSDQNHLESGVVVTGVAPDSPAAAAGLRVGDRIEQVGGEAVTGGGHFLRLIQLQPADTQFSILRDSETEPLIVEVHLDGVPIHLGISWREDDAEPNSVYLTRVVPGSPAASAGLRVHDRIHLVNGNSFDGTAGFANLLKEALALDQPLTLTIERAGRIADVPVGPNPLAGAERSGG